MFKKLILLALLALAPFVAQASDDHTTKEVKSYLGEPKQEDKMVCGKDTGEGWPCLVYTYPNKDGNRVLLVAFTQDGLHFKGAVVIDQAEKQMYEVTDNFHKWLHVQRIEKDSTKL